MKALQSALLITMEGAEGCGKTTQIQLLERYLKTRGLRVFLTREPGGTLIGDRIRSVLLDKTHKAMSATCETLLYMASRSQLVDEVILKAMAQSDIVLCDRWLDATVAYQGYGHGVSVRWIKSLGKVAAAGFKPALTIFLDLPLLTGLQRANKRSPSDRMESEALCFHKKVRRGYLAIAKEEPKRFVRVRARSTDSPGKIHEKVIAVVDRVLHGD